VRTFNLDNLADFRRKVLKTSDDARKDLKEEALANAMTPTDEFKFTYFKGYEEACYKPRDTDEDLEILN
jgi:hypothetical protein